MLKFNKKKAFNTAKTFAQAAASPKVSHESKFRKKKNGTFYS